MGARGDDNRLAADSVEGDRNTLLKEAVASCASVPLGIGAQEKPFGGPTGSSFAFGRTKKRNTKPHGKTLERPFLYLCSFAE